MEVFVRSRLFEGWSVTNDDVWLEYARGTTRLHDDVECQLAASQKFHLRLLSPMRLLSPTTQNLSTGQRHGGLLTIAIMSSLFFPVDDILLSFGDTRPSKVDVVVKAAQ